MPDGGVLFSSESEVYFGVNNVGASVWALLAQSSTFEELCDRLAAQYSDVSIDRIRKDVTAFLDDLRASGLVVEAQGEVTDASGAA